MGILLFLVLTQSNIEIVFWELEQLKLRKQIQVTNAKSHHEFCKDLLRFQIFKSFFSRRSCNIAFSRLKFLRVFLEYLFGIWFVTRVRIDFRFVCIRLKRFFIIYVPRLAAWVWKIFLISFLVFPSSNYKCQYLNTCCR